MRHVSPGLGLLAAFLLWGCPGGGAAAAPPPPESGTPAMGINLSRASYFTPGWVFVDAFRLSRYVERSKGDRYPWQFTDDEGLGMPALDDDGYPLGLKRGQRVEALCLRGIEGHYPGGTYTVLFDGDGEVATGQDAERARLDHDGQGEGRFTVEVTPSNAGVVVKILRSNPADRVRNVRLIMPGFEETYREQPFHPLFLERLAPFSVVRYMDWGFTNHSQVTTWADRRRPTYRTQHYHRAGVAYELMLQLSNTLGADPWICVPHLADDDHVTRLARLVGERLQPGLKVWVEYSNEVWNGIFDQAKAVRALAGREGISPQEQYARRSKQVFSIFERELGGRDRLVRVVATHLANPSKTTARILEQIGAGEADVLAVGMYVGGVLGRKDWQSTRSQSAEQVIDAMLADVTRRRGKLRETRALGEAKGLDLVAYEGGQHLAGASQAAKDDEALNALFDAANRHPRMAEVYEALFDIWEAEGGNLFCHFNDAYQPSKHGRWGLLEYQDQALAEAPKYRVTAARARLWAESSLQPPDPPTPSPR